MSLTKLLTTLILSLSAALNFSAQTPKLVWKNLQGKYERFEDIKPVLKNEGDQPIYFDCSDVAEDSFPKYSYELKFKFLFNNVEDHWDWNVFYCGTESRAEMKARKKEEKRIASLKKQGKYLPAGCRLNPNQEYAVRITGEMWKYIRSSGSTYYSYPSGRYKFTLEYEWANAQNPIIAESPAFVVALKEE